MNSNNSKKMDLEDRLVKFSVGIIEISKRMSNIPAGRHLSFQIVRSGTSPALNYGEAKSAESRKDFIHKVKIVLKELRETRVSLKIIQQTCLYHGREDLNLVIAENTELIAIFVSSVNTALKNMNNSK